ncbi:MAG: hypothetical protein QXS20_09425 [Candidatus Thorarchaeota archaeon]
MSGRTVPRQIAEFGERNFRESDCDSVQVLRLKAVTIRKHFRNLKGVLYLVAVISTDRVRIYPFAENGLLLGGENLTHDEYHGIRRQSQLIVTYERPRPPTQEEVRMQVTQEMQQTMARSVRRVARLLAMGVPEIPPIFIERTRHGVMTQHWGMAFGQDGSILFDQDAVDSSWAEGLALRTSFLLTLEPEKRSITFSQLVANSVAFTLLHDPQRSEWLRVWKSNTHRDNLAMQFVSHFIHNALTYEGSGYSRLHRLISQAPAAGPLELWEQPLRIIHDTLEVSFGTEDYETLRDFCNTLSHPHVIREKTVVPTRIHLCPRVVVDPSPLGVILRLQLADNRASDESDWLRAEYISGSDVRLVSVNTASGTPLEYIEYGLNMGDVAPKSGGLLPHGRDMVGWASESLCGRYVPEPMLRSRLSLGVGDVSASDLGAVIERLATGDRSVLLDTLVGSPERVESIISAGLMMMLPDFNHIGVDPNLLLAGEANALQSLVESYSVEWTLLCGRDISAAIVSAPSRWGSAVLSHALDAGISVFPLRRILLGRRLLRTEDLFPRRAEMLM